MRCDVAGHVHNSGVGEGVRCAGSVVQCSVFAVCYAASASFITPVGYQTNLMVFGPGGYRYSDYIRVGLPLGVILWIVSVAIIPMIWPF